MSRGSPAWFLAFLALALAPAARADGLFVWRNEQIDIHEPEQKALIVFDEGVEDLVLSGGSCRCRRCRRCFRRTSCCSRS